MHSRKQRFQRTQSSHPVHDACSHASDLDLGKHCSAVFFYPNGKTGSVNTWASCKTMGSRPATRRSQLSRCVPIFGPASLPSLIPADPSIILVNSVWYSFATRTIGSSIHIQVAWSNDFKHWSLVKNNDGSQVDALPYLPTWIDGASPNTWAPDVQLLVSSKHSFSGDETRLTVFVEQDDESFVMYRDVSFIKWDWH